MKLNHGLQDVGHIASPGRIATLPGIHFTLAMATLHWGSRALDITGHNWRKGHLQKSYKCGMVADAVAEICVEAGDSLAELWTEVDGTSDSGHYKAMRSADLTKMIIILNYIIIIIIIIKILKESHYSEVCSNSLYYCDTIPYTFHETPKMCGNDAGSHLNLVRRNAPV